MKDFETCRRLKEKEITRSIPVIFMTALSDTVDKVKGFDLGGVDYITKPLDHEEVLARVKTHLTIRKLQKQIEEQNKRLEKQNEQLMMLNTSKDKFLSIISHDLRNPLQALLGYCELMLMNLDRYSKEDIKKYIELMQRSGKNLHNLLEHLLLWSKLQKGTIEYDPKCRNIQELINNNIILLSPNAHQKKIKLLTSVRSRSTVHVDKNMIDEVIRNLISNALKFTDTGGTVTISATEDNEFVHVSISDTGIGMSEEAMEGLFRIDVKRNKLMKGKKGTGLGLIICKDLVERNGGNIKVESKIGKGSTFTFTLPRCDSTKEKESTL
jgi:two-component system sensor histidine kinase/response regulator